MPPDEPTDEPFEETTGEGPPAEEPEQGLPTDFHPEAREEREIAAGAAHEKRDFLGLMGHLYRGEVGRTTTWRTRLDRTSNWSVLLTATLLTWAFSSQGNPHGVILLGMIMVTIFLWFEARRYRMYDVWRSRVRMLEENVFANALNPEGASHRGWRTMLSRDLRRPAIKVSYLEATARRLRRIYLALLLILLVSWVVHLTLAGGTSIPGIVAAARVAGIPGAAVFAGVAGYYTLLLLIAFWPLEREAKGEMVRDEELASRWKNGNR